jgi:L-rhamnose mutarotase
MKKINEISSNHNIEYGELLNYLKRKDIQNYNIQELELLTKIFKLNEYNVDFLKIVKK